MIQTINHINSTDKRCLDVAFNYVEMPDNLRNGEVQTFHNSLYIISHGFSYLDGRKMFKESGDKMGLDRT